MLRSLRPLPLCIALTVWTVHLAAATGLLQSSVKPSPSHLRKVVPGSSNPSSFAKLFTSTAIPALGDSPSNQFRDNMTATIESHLGPVLLQEIREFWFEHLDDADSFVVAPRAASLRWYAGGDELDQQCVKRFAPALEAIHASGAKTGEDILRIVQPSEPLDWLSLVLLLDQIPRNCYRGDSASIVFSFFDPIARDITRAAIERGIPDSEPQIRWQFTYRSWFSLPLMHSEDVSDHMKATEEFQKIADDIQHLANPEISAKDAYESKAIKVIQRDVDAAKVMAQVSIDFEKQHYDIIKRFGRYPHRNPVLGREHTAEETEYLESGGETFSGKASKSQ